MVGDEEIAQLFSDNYNHPYNSVSYGVGEMNVINTEINKQIKEYVAYDISVDEVIEGVQQLSNHIGIYYVSKMHVCSNFGIHVYLAVFKCIHTNNIYTVSG